MEQSDEILSWRDYFNPKIAAMAVLGLGAGLPYLLVYSTLNYWLSESDVSKTTIGLFAAIGIIYSIKVIWAPVVDHLKLPVLSRLGRRRSWILTAQVGIAISVFMMSTFSPIESLKWIAIAGICVAFSSATQDIALDAWRIEAVHPRLQGLMSASYIFGYRLGLMIAGAGALFIAEFASWTIAYQVMAAIMIIPILVTLCLPNDGVDSRNVDLAPLAIIRTTVINPFAEFWRRYGGIAWLLILFIAFYRISDIAMGGMANPLYHELGFSKSEVASIAKIFGFVMLIAGAFLAGVWVVRRGVYEPLVVGAVLVAITNLLFSWLASTGYNLQALTLVISADNLAGGIASTAFVAFLSALTNREYTATQYALFGSLMTLPGKVFSMGSGWLVDHYGFHDFFLLCAVAGIPPMLVALWLSKNVALKLGDPKH